ncbi:MAG: GPP34 family phosphoprotein [Eubacteriales bacterium]|nr:GPP34 family phosphoprotein [Eubacteriales bacterium]
MNRTSIAQQYFILTVDQNGHMPVMRKDSCNATLVAACIMDLLLHGSITMERKKITVIATLPDGCGHLASLYAYLAQKPRSLNKLTQDYMLSTSRRIKQLSADIGKSLLPAQAVTKSTGGWFGNQTVYIPDPDCQNALAATLRSAVMQDSGLSPSDAALLFLLHETKTLNQYFSKQETAAWKQTWRAIKRDPQNKQLADMIHYVDDLNALMSFWVLHMTGQS